MLLILERPLRVNKSARPPGAVLAPWDILMEFVLVVADDCPSCDKARAIWESECGARGHRLAVVRADSQQGARLLAGQTLTTVPAVLVNSRIVAVGLQTPVQVRDLLDSHAAQGGSP